MDLETLIARHYNGIRNRAVAALGDAHAAEDLTQEAFTILWTAHQNGSVIGDPAGFLNGTIRNLVITHIRDKSRRRALWKEFLGLAEEPVTVDTPAESHEGLRELIDRLWPEGRALIIGHYYLGMSIDELASQLKLRRSTAYVRYRQAMERLRELARAQGFLD